MTAGLDDDRHDDLAAARAHRAQQAELVGSLRHEDRERVEDDERGDDEADGGEPEQHAGEEVEELGDVLPGVGRDLRGGRHLERAARARRRLRGGARRSAHAGLAGHVDRVEQPRPGHDPLRGGQVERRERERPDLAAVAEREHAHDREALLRSGREHVDRVADAEPVVACGLDVHRDLAAAAEARGSVGHRGRRAATARDRVPPMNDTPNVGTPPVSIGSPSLPTNCA